MLKRGRKSFPLSEEQKRRLLLFIEEKNLTLQELAELIKITHNQLRHPLTDKKQGCSKVAYLAIQRFLAKQVKP